MKKRCTSCRLEKPAPDFNKNKSKKDGLQARCRSCDQERGRRRYRENIKIRKQLRKNAKRYVKRNRQFIFEYLSTHSCIDCGESDPIVLDFDHLNPKQKKSAVSDMVQGGHGLSSIQEEIDKCVVRCANCHRKKTAKENNHYKWLLS